MMEAKPKRPWTVLLAQIVLLGIALIFLAMPVRRFLSVQQELSYYGVTVSQALEPLIREMLMAVIFITPFVLAVIASCWGLAKRSSLGRWSSIGILFITFLVSTCLFFLKYESFVFEIDPTPPAVGGVGNRILLLIMSVVPIVLVFRLLTGLPEKMFFQWKPRVPVSQPPPPPTFDE